jgi:hypothetical protein
MAARIANSRLRADDCTNNRFATFAHVISSTNPTAAWSNKYVVAAPGRNVSDIGLTWTLLSESRLISAPLRIPDTSASAWTV